MRDWDVSVADVAALANPQENAQVSAHLGEECRIGFGMECGFAGGPVQALEMIYKHGTFDLFDRCGERKGIGFSPAGQRTDNDQPTGSVIALFGNHQSGPALCLLASCLRIEIEPNDISRSWNVRTWNGRLH